MSEVLLEARELSRSYVLPDGRRLPACRGVSLELRRGETLGIVGESGCGKSTLLRMLVRLERPDGGRIIFRGEDITDLRGAALRRSRRHIQMVFQDPNLAFYSRMRAGEAVCEPLLNFGLIKKDGVPARARELLEMVELPPDFAGRFPHDMSGGQRQRLGIARALALEPEVLICDEATAALDVSVQKRIIELLVRLQRERELSMIFVCHDLALVQSLSHRVMVMYLGCVMEVLPGAAVAGGAVHPYSKALISSVFTLDMDFSRPIEPAPGEARSALEAGDGCPFCERCAWRRERCRNERPALREIAPGHFAACHIL